MTLWEDILMHPERAFICDLEALPTMALLNLSQYLSELVLERLEEHETQMAELMLEKVKK